MPSVINLRGIDIAFPYDNPYALQKAYMEKVLECLQEQKHGVLESPTGTGKTLCLFAPVTAWLRNVKMQGKLNQDKTSMNEKFNNVNTGLGRSPRVWYTSRTHSQIAQTISEVRRCNIEGLSIRVMGARDQLCINPDVLSEKESYVKSIKCKELVKNRACRFYKNLDFSKHAPEIYQPGEVMDIEDLVSRGRSCGVCPYHLARGARDSADIVLMPYNYVIDRESRGPDESGTYQNGILIFDEGHNVPNTCEESYEFAITSVDLALGISSVKELMEAIERFMRLEIEEESPVDFSRHADNCIKLLKVLKALESQLVNFPVSNEQRSLREMYEFFENAEITQETSEAYLDYLFMFQQDSSKLQLTGPMMTTFNLLEKMLQTLFGAAIKSFDAELVDRSFKFVISEDAETVKNSKKMSLFCFNPSFGIKDVLLLGIRTMIVTSGTLSPLKNFIHELGLSPENTLTLVNGHIASKSQVPFVILGTGVGNSSMDASFQNRTTESYMHSLGMTLTNLVCSVPDGVLLLFSSYSVMRSIKDYWEGKSGIWNRLNFLKRIFLEPKGKDEFINCMENYRRAIDSGNGAVLMGVLRGKISEGMDFKNQYCRGVFIVGVPFPPIMDPRVKGKMKYAESLKIYNPHTKRMECLYGNGVFISVEAMKATNQAIGRVIRHAEDYGAIVLVDHRFARPTLFNNISGWLRDDRPIHVNFPVAKKTLREFFAKIHANELTVPEIRVQALAANGDPVPACINYDVYDHKTATRCNAPFIASSLDNGKYHSRSSEAHVDNSRDRIGLDIYKQDGRSKSFASSSSLPGAAPATGAAASLDLLESDGACSSRISAFATHSLQAGQSPKRKHDEELSEHQQQKKVRRDKLKWKGFNVEPEAAQQLKRTPASSWEIQLYIQKVMKDLPENDKANFKEITWKYLKKQSTIQKTVAAIELLLSQLPDKEPLLLEFEKCVHTKDLTSWRDLSAMWH